MAQSIKIFQNLFCQMKIVLSLFLNSELLNAIYLKLNTHNDLDGVLSNFTDHRGTAELNMDLKWLV